MDWQADRDDKEITSVCTWERPAEPIAADDGAGAGFPGYNGTQAPHLSGSFGVEGRFFLRPVTGGLGMRAIVSAAVLALLAFTSCGPADAPKEAPAEDLLFPLPPQEVAAGRFEQWAR